MHHDNGQSGRRIATARRRAGGFTLLETVMASALLAFCVAALLQAIVAGQMQTYHALHETRAAALAEAMLDELLSVPYDELPEWHGYEQPAGEVADVHEVKYDAPYQRFDQTVAVTDQTVNVPGLGDVSGRMVTITVRDEGLGVWTVQRFVRSPNGAADDDEMAETP